ncbi:hypothetical protein GCM10023346_06000 [Arthrobacter gyeryongensis]|uniref:Uncharacterized protein n=1 Tax=Arthrobacter gyeryongensis TaxID=1650592 RepID=A0ABP9S0T3_9MICC
MTLAETETVGDADCGWVVFTQAVSVNAIARLTIMKKRAETEVRGVMVCYPQIGFKTKRFQKW